MYCSVSKCLLNSILLVRPPFDNLNKDHKINNWWIQELWVVGFDPGPFNLLSTSTLNSLAACCDNVNMSYARNCGEQEQNLEMQVLFWESEPPNSVTEPGLGKIRCREAARPLQRFCDLLHCQVLARTKSSWTLLNQEKITFNANWVWKAVERLLEYCLLIFKRSDSLCGPAFL